MKKLFSFLLALNLLFLGFVFRIPTAYASETDTTWIRCAYIDKFGDPTEEYYLINRPEFRGVYNNESVKNGILDAVIIADSKGVGIYLFEAGENQVKKNGKYNVDIKDVTGKVYSLSGFMIDDRIELDQSCVDILVDSLCAEGQVGFYIEDSSGSSNYVFKAKCANFAELYLNDIVVQQRETMNETVQSADSKSMNEIYEQINKSIVKIIVTGTEESKYGNSYTYKRSLSGIILTEDGYILTNYPGLENYDTVTVTTHEGIKYDAEVIGGEKRNDYSIIKIEEDNLSPVVFGNSSNLYIGEEIYSISCTEDDEYNISIVPGKIATQNVKYTNGAGYSLRLIQSSSLYQQGRLGGAFCDSNGEIIATIGGVSDSSGYEYGLPINNIQKQIKSIIESGYIEKPYIGLTCSTVSQEQEGILGEVARLAGVENGAGIHETSKGSPAEAAGISKNDLITEIDGQRINSSEDLVEVISNAVPGSTISLTIYRLNSDNKCDKFVVHIPVEKKLSPPDVPKSVNPEKEEKSQSQETPDPKYSFTNESGEYWGGENMEDFFKYFFGN